MGAESQRPVPWRNAMGLNSLRCFLVSKMSAASKFLQRFLLDRRSWATSAFILAVSAFVWAGLTSFQEEPLDLLLNLGGVSSDPKSFHVVVDSFDTVSGTLHVRGQVTFNVNKLDLAPATYTLFQGPDAVRDAKVFYGPFRIDDMGETFDYIGLVIPQTEIPAQVPMPPADSTQSRPGEIDADLRALGNPRFYPFDSYLVMASISCPSWTTQSGESPAATC